MFLFIYRVLLIQELNLKAHIPTFPPARPKRNYISKDRRRPPARRDQCAMVNEIGGEPDRLCGVG